MYVFVRSSETNVDICILWVLLYITNEGEVSKAIVEEPENVEEQCAWNDYVCVSISKTNMKMLSLRILPCILRTGETIQSSTWKFEFGKKSSGNNKESTVISVC